MIILLGFPKSGTTSFQILFEKLGLKTIHWTYNGSYIGSIIKKNKLENKLLLSSFEDIEAITQMDFCISKDESYWPQLTDYKQLYEENPNAIFILNKRNPNKILESFKKWFNLEKRFYQYNPEIIKDRSDNGFKNLIKEHYNDVETYFNNKPNARFIIFDIEKDNIRKLESYIDLKGITEFPHENKNK